MAILKHCQECMQAMHPSFGSFCSEVCEAASLIKRDGDDDLLDITRDDWVMDNSTRGLIRDGGWID